MEIYEPDSSVTLSMPFVTSRGTNIVPTALSYSVLDETGTEVVASTPIPVFDASVGEIDIEVTPEENDLQGELYGYREVVLAMTYNGNTINSRVGYILRVPHPLEIMDNSFMTYPEALIYSMKLTDTAGWEVAHQDQRTAALQQAFDHISAFSYSLDYTDGTVFEGNLKDMTYEEWVELEPAIIEDFRKAQFIQADFLLGGKPIETDIAQGLQSSTTGETSQFYRPRPSLSLSVCRDAFKYVGKYRNWSLAIGRG